ncbi:eukaryotic translation initiation factor 4E-2-like [Planoprotostelium fungivorum]|uniref:Eukaryotic translation initiation factor 4E-2-like n=1 Tax=Planoprotostelium fungivorum TaxID=1890364 RepID=A0A2P6N4T6_9EUKA|nr:eukaryotic translation initiation factor 4E-2-like [Planoprotostelium fungivorum]
MVNENPNPETQKFAEGTTDPSKAHALLHSWTLWYDSGAPANNASWGDNIKKVFTVSSVEDFWRLYNNVSLPSQLQTGTTYNFFKQGIEPKWEDPNNDQGGRWTIIVPKTKGLIDRLWLWLVLACVGEQLEDDQNQICGAVVNVRKNQDKISLWTKDAENEEAGLKIGKNIKKLLELSEAVCYQGHSNTRVNKYTV